MIESIRELLARAEDARQHDCTQFLTSRDHQKHREAWILGHFARFYNRQRDVAFQLLFAEGGDKEDIPSDFAVYARRECASWLCDIEIFEAMNPEVKRTEAWRSNPDEPLVEPAPGGIGGDTYRNLLRKIDDKYAKARRSPTWLLIYDSLTESRRQQEEDSLYQAVRCAVEKQERETFEEVWLLAGDAETARRVFP